METSGFVYILTNKRKTTLYIGVTSDLRARLWEHENHFFEGFTKKYNVTFLLYYEYFESIESAIAREKELKGWLRRRKNELINQKNKNWSFLNKEIHEDIYNLIDKD